VRHSVAAILPEGREAVKGSGKFVRMQIDD
jgi:hypothetical protein